jgi:periodic tryptophan protein 1
MTSLISSISWIPRGAAAQNPQKYTVDEQELERIGQLAKGQLEGARIELELAKLVEGDAEGDENEDEEWEE